MIHILKLFAPTVAAVLVLDGLWLGLVARGFYQRQIGHLMAETFTWWPVAVFYPLYAVGLTVFAVAPAVADRSLVSALWRGALLGLMAYSAYDLTNQATLTRWPLGMTLVDIVWGVTMSAVASAIAYVIITRWL